MARIKDLWFNARPDPATGERVKTRKHGRGKRWLVEYDDPTGRILTKAFDRKPDASDFLTNVAADVQRGEYIDPRLGRKLFRDLAEDWSAGRVIAETTAGREASITRQLVGVFGDYPIGEILPSLVRRWFAGRTKVVVPATANTELWQLTSILELAVEDDMIRKNPAGKIDRLPKGRPAVTPWSLATIRGILDHFAEQSPHLWPIPALAAGAGLRQGEAFGVAVDDIDFLRRTLKVQRQIQRINGRGSVFAPPKRNSTGTVPLEVELVEKLARHVERYPPLEVTLPWVERGAKPGETRTVRLLTYGRRGAVLARGTFNEHHWASAARAVGIVADGNAGIHQLRHAYASYLLAEGQPITVVQARLRHRRLAETYETYAHLTSEEVVVDAIASLFRSGPVPSGSVSVTEHRRTWNR